jgi:hypothetical protein
MRKVRGRPRRWCALKWKNKNGNLIRQNIYIDDFGNPMRFLSEYKEGVAVQGQAYHFRSEDIEGEIEVADIIDGDA